MEYAETVGWYRGNGLLGWRRIEPASLIPVPNADTAPNQLFGILVLLYWPRRSSVQTLSGVVSAQRSNQLKDL